MLVFGGAKVSATTLLTIAVAVAAVTSAGEIVLRLSRLNAAEKNWLSMSFVVGVTATSLPMMFVTLLFPVPASQAFVISVACLLAIGLAVRNSAPAPSTKLVELTALALMVAIVGFAVKIPVQSTAGLFSNGKLEIWSDYFLHGMTLNAFGDALSVGHGNPVLAGTARPLYHYAPYMLPAAATVLTGLSGPAAAVSLLLPLGLLTGIIGLYALAAELGGTRAAALAITIILCLPQPSAITKAGFFDFYWLLFAAPGSGYAIGVGALACVALNRHLESGDRRPGYLGAILLMSLIVVRVQMFLLLAPAFFGVLFIHHFPYLGRRVARYLPLAAIGLFILLALYPPANHFWINHSNPGAFLSSALSSSPYYSDLHEYIIRHFSWAAFAIESGLVLTTALGIFVVVFPVLEALRVRRCENKAMDFLPWLMILTFLGLVLFAPMAANGDWSEYKQRHFVLLYPLIVIFSVRSAFRRPGRRLAGEQANCGLETGLLLFSLLFVAGWTWKHNPARPMIEVMPWAGSYFEQVIAPGVAAASEFIGNRSKPGDVLAFDVVSSKSSLIGPAIEIIALSGLPSYAARTDLYAEGSHATADIVASRIRDLAAAENEKDWNQVRQFLRSKGIRWYVFLNGRYPHFDPQGEHVMFQASGVRVYDAGSVTPMDE